MDEPLLEGEAEPQNPSPQLAENEEEEKLLPSKNNSGDNQVEQEKVTNGDAGDDHAEEEKMPLTDKEEKAEGGKSNNEEPLDNKATKEKKKKKKKKSTKDKDKRDKKKKKKTKKDGDKVKKKEKRIQEEEHEEEVPYLPDDFVVEVPSDWSVVSPLPSVHGQQPRRSSTESKKKVEDSGTGSLTNLEADVDKLNHHVKKMSHKLDHQKQMLIAMEEDYFEERDRVEALNKKLEKTEKKLKAKRRHVTLAEDEEGDEEENDDDDADDAEKVKKVKPKKKTKKKAEGDDKERKKKKKKKESKHRKYDDDDYDRRKRVHKKKKSTKRKATKIDYKALGYKDYKDYRERSKYRGRKQPKRRSFGGTEQRREPTDYRGGGRDTPHSWPAKRVRDAQYASGRQTPDWLRASRTRRSERPGPPGVIYTDRERKNGAQKESSRAFPDEDTASLHPCNFWSLVRILALPAIVLVVGAVIVIVIFAIDRDRNGDSENSDSMDLESLLPDYTRDSLTNTSTPQYRAYDWFNLDTARDSYSNSRKLQRFALATLYYSTSGDDWAESSNWLSYGDDECEWYTSTSDSMSSCSDDSAFLHLALAENNLEGTIPPEIELLQSLRTLKLNGNAGLGGTIPSQLGMLAALERLEVYQANLTGFIPAEITLLSNLERFELYENALSGPIPSEIGTLRLLSQLRLERNDLSDAIPSEIGLLKRLDTLYLYENVLSGSIPSETGSVPFLREAFLYMNRLEQAIPSEMGQLPLLEKLWLDRNDLTGLLPSELGLLMNLEELILFGNSFTGPIPSELSMATGLERLELLDNSFTGSVPSGLCSLLDSNSSLQIVAIDCDEVSCDCGCTCN